MWLRFHCLKWEDLERLNKKVLPRAQQPVEDPETSLFRQLAQQVSVYLLETDRIDLKNKTSGDKMNQNRKWRPLDFASNFKSNGIYSPVFLLISGGIQKRKL